MMKPTVKLLLLLFCALLAYCEGKSDGEPLRPKDLDKVKVDAKDFDKIKTIHTNWYVHSVKALIAQLSRNILPKLSDETRKQFLDCLSTIHDKKDLVESSKCVVKAREQYNVERKSRPGMQKKLQLEINVIKPKKKQIRRLSIKKLEELEKDIPRYFRPSTTTTTTSSTTTTTTTTQAPTTRKTINNKKEILEKKRKVLERARYLKNAALRAMPQEDRMRVWKNEKKMELMKKSQDIREFRRKWRLQNFRRPAGSRMYSNLRAKRSLNRLVVDSVSKSDGEHGFFVKTMDRMPSLRTKTKSPVERVTSLLRTFLTNQNSTDANWADTYKALINLKKKMDEKEKESGARVYNERMLDLVLDTEPKDLSYFDKKKMPGLVRDAFDLMSTIEKTGKKGESNFKFLSPRFASVMPDKNENRGRLSPSILSFYNDESEDQILPLPKMLDATGMRGKDRDSILELVMEVSGVKSIVHDAMKMLKSTDMPELDLAMNDNAKKSLQMVQDIQKSYNRKQRKEMKNSGFTLLDPKQMDKLMTDQGIAGRDDIFNLKEYALMSMVERKEMVWDMIRGIAFGVSGIKAPPHHIESPGNSSGSGNGTLVRVKRQGGVWGPHILSPTVLTPLLFTPIYGLNVLGPTVLSPGLFTPLILNPAVLSPYVFSPTVGIPFILSPYLLSPYVFSPLVMAPFILNPYVLAPNVFNPYVLSPLILSPLVICPDVVSPMTLGGAILSPAVLSPSVLSKSYVMANVLSPTFLS